VRGSVGTGAAPPGPEFRLDLADTVVKDTEGRDVRVGDLWRDGPAVVVFLRHYG